MNDLCDVRGKTALITGGSRGIGEMIASGLVDAGVKVFISARNADICDATAAALSKRGSCIAIPCELSTLDGVSWLAERVSRLTERLDILVLNAGSGSGGPMESFSEKNWDKVLDLNLKSPFFLTQKLLPLLRATGTTAEPARIIVVGSTAGTMTSTVDVDSHAYSASKAAVHHLSRLMAIRFAPTITVNAIAPGPFPTRMIAFALENGREKVEANVPCKRLGRASDIAGAVIFLASSAGSYITGAVLPVDGGFSLT
jgi:NAD(P)-dependent dehydrogenase (short-subunit alcohol dehydrogenase family)